MAIPTHPVRRTRRERRFDLRATALFFVLLAIVLCVLAFLARTAAGIVEHRPLWAGVLAALGVAGVLMSRSGWRRVSVARCAGRAARALEEAAEIASDAASTQAGTDRVTAIDQTFPRPAEPRAEATVPLARLADYAELDPDGFEEAVADLCAAHGCREVEVVGGAGDLGADVLALTPDGRRLVIQCKQYGDAHKVGSQDMQRFGGTCFTIHEADVAALVTTSEFTDPALEYARQCGIVCVDGPGLLAWRHGTGPSPWQLTGAAATPAGAERGFAYGDPAEADECHGAR
ncbi:restriction endonuclease [Streptomyces sp. NPDC006739]|uniref:restriction endonuclease n=1 Tax=Streptomyces sp. NPDC006739 TaxID=3364763 RepID=UPI0036D1A2D7